MARKTVAEVANEVGEIRETLADLAKGQVAIAKALKSSGTKQAKPAPAPREDDGDDQPSEKAEAAGFAVTRGKGKTKRTLCLVRQSAEYPSMIEFVPTGDDGEVKTRKNGKPYRPQRVYGEQLLAVLDNHASQVRELLA